MDSQIHRDSVVQSTKRLESFQNIFEKFQIVKNLAKRFRFMNGKVFFFRMF